jgi:putative transcriptional regulator
MTIRHHVSDPILTAYAAGDLPEAFNLIVATHVSLCDSCRASLMALETLGGAVLESADMAELAAMLPQATRRREAPTRRVGLFPKPLADYVGGDVADVRWSSVGMGVRQAILKTDRSASARLLYIPGGARMPDHGHRGLEMTLVLQGAYADAADRFGPGDIETADEGVQHTPVAEGGPACICLAVTDAPLRFNRLLPRLAQPIFRI